MYKSLIATALLGALAAARPEPSRLGARDILTALPQNAEDKELLFQPWVDYDRDGCYNTAAVDAEGNVNPGKGVTGTPQGDCRDPHQLENSNTYSRARCNNGICAIMYEYYFEKDQAGHGSWGSGHKHDWENVVVFARDRNVIYTCVSGHGDYGGGSETILGGEEGEGTHPYVVYNKDGGFTHRFREASQGDVDDPETYTGGFYSSPLVGYYVGWPQGAWDAVVEAWPSGVSPKIQDSVFAEYLQKAKDRAGDIVADFNPEVDE